MDGKWREHEWKVLDQRESLRKAGQREEEWGDQTGGNEGWTQTLSATQNQG